ncbi:MAG: glycosyltransferase family 2 protein [Ancrocorticia sp.]|jgi:rhamnosyltransferase|nr:glycosyltransferase family 2 protein [Ancrocorticia sp.]
MALHRVPRVVAVVITYNPPDDCRQLLESLAAQCPVVVVDNGSSLASVTRLKAACNSLSVHLHTLPTNVGIAAAQNIGIARAEQLGATHVYLSDHDSHPAPGLVAALLDVISEDSRIAAVGPLVAEEREGADELVYMARKWTPKRATPAELQEERLDVAFIIASGCLIDLNAFHAIGQMREELFIDHVDLEWGLRARKKGYRLVVAPHLRLVHTLGDQAVRLPGRPQPIHVHAPFRNYYIVRNTIWLIRRKNLMPWRWRVRYAYWLLKYIAFNGCIVSDRRSERRRMLRLGFCNGSQGRMGRLEIWSPKHGEERG